MQDIHNLFGTTTNPVFSSAEDSIPISSFCREPSIIARDCQHYRDHQIKIIDTDSLNIVERRESNLVEFKAKKGNHLFKKPPFVMVISTACTIHQLIHLCGKDKEFIKKIIVDPNFLTIQKFLSIDEGSTPLLLILPWQILIRVSRLDSIQNRVNLKRKVGKSCVSV